MTDYRSMFIITPVCMLLALLCMTRVKRGEARADVTVDSTLGQVGDTDI